VAMTSAVSIHTAEHADAKIDFPVNFQQHSSLSSTSEVMTPVATAEYSEYEVFSLATIQRAIDGFFGCSGKLFHVFTQDQVSAFLKDAFHDGKLDESQKASICCIAAISAVGTQYSSIDSDINAGMEFYENARLYFEVIIEERPYDSIKICALLAVYNIMHKATVALAYVGKSPISLTSNSY
jgi:hypothetical protein